MQVTLGRRTGTHIGTNAVVASGHFLAQLNDLYLRPAIWRHFFGSPVPAGAYSSKKPVVIVVMACLALFSFPTFCRADTDPVEEVLATRPTADAKAIEHVSELIKTYGAHPKIFELRYYRTGQLMGSAPDSEHYQAIIKDLEQLAHDAGIESELAFRCNSRIGEIYYHCLKDKQEAYRAYKAIEEHPSLTGHTLDTDCRRIELYVHIAEAAFATEKWQEVDNYTRIVMAYPYLGMDDRVMHKRFYEFYDRAGRLFIGAFSDNPAKLNSVEIYPSHPELYKLRKQLIAQYIGAEECCVATATESADSPPSEAGANADLLVQEQMDLAEKAPDRDTRLIHLRKALTIRPDDPGNLAIEFQIAVELSQRYDPKYPDQTPKREEAMAVYKGLLKKYNHMDYYSSEPVVSSSDPQIMVPGAYIHMACLYRGLDRDSAKARECLILAMDCFKQTYEKRIEDWSSAPAPPRPDSRFVELSVMEMGKWEARTARWNKRRQDAANGDVFGPLEMTTVKAAVRQYGYSHGRQKPSEVPAVMGEIIKMFPDTPMAKVAQEHAQRAMTLATPSDAEVGNLASDLHQVDAMRAGEDTPFDKVEAECMRLLQSYTKPEEHGRIYFMLAHVYAQSGHVRPDQSIKWAKKALEYPLDPENKQQAYVYWGDAIQLSHRGVRGQQLAAVRREAVLPYLQGLKELVAYELLELPPEPAGLELFDWSGSQDDPEYQKRLRTCQAQVDAADRIRFQNRMIRYRDMQTGQIADMYSKLPFATDELESLARDVLKDDAAVNRLMASVKERVQKREEQVARRVETLSYSENGQQKLIVGRNNEIYGTQEAADLVAQAHKFDPMFCPRAQADRDKAASLYQKAIAAQPGAKLNAPLADRIAQMYAFYEDKEKEVSPNRGTAAQWWERCIDYTSPSQLLWAQAQMGLASVGVVGRDYFSAIQRYSMILDMDMSRVELPDWKVWPDAETERGRAVLKLEQARLREALEGIHALAAEKKLGTLSRISKDEALEFLQSAAIRYKGTPTGEWASNTIAKLRSCPPPTN